VYHEGFGWNGKLSGPAKERAEGFRMDGWDIVMIAAAGYIAVISLVRLMARRRNQLVEQVRQQMEEQAIAKPASKSETEETERGVA